MAEQLFVHRGGVFRARHREHLHLGELVHAVEALALAAVRPGFGAEAVRDAGELARQIAFGEQRVEEEAAERDLRGAHQTEIGVGDRVDLRLVAARVVAEAVDDLGLREVGRRVQLEAVGAQHLDREPLERQLEQHGFVLQVVELGARHLGAGLEVDEVVFLGELEMIERLEREVRRFAVAADLARVVLAAFGHVGVHEVRDARHRAAQREFGRRQLAPRARRRRP